MTKPQPLQKSWYDYPQFCDLAFRSETPLEADFVEAACHKYCPFPPRRLLEPACGGGRLVAELAARGYEMTAFDLNRPSLDYLRRRLARRGLHATVFEADMADFSLPNSLLKKGDRHLTITGSRGVSPVGSEPVPLFQQAAKPVDAAVCTVNTFRHLLTEQSARRHLECISENLRPGGIYILGFHLLPMDASEEDTERWTERRGRTQVTVTLRVLSTNRHRRIERLRVCLLARVGAKELRLRDEFSFRMYTAAQFRRLLASVPSLELCGVYDFWYEIDHPMEFNDDRTDTVFVLRKRGGRGSPATGRAF